MTDDAVTRGNHQHEALDAFVAAVGGLGWVTDVWLAGSLASGDHVPGVSDIDLVAVTSRAPTPGNREALHRIHEGLDATVGRGADLGCTYVTDDRIGDRTAEHPTWTHGRMVDRWLSAIVRAELLTYGIALAGRAPCEVLAPLEPGDVRAAAEAELEGYWSWAAARPWLFLDPTLADLALVSMARIRHAVASDELVTKSEAITAVHAPRAVVDGLRARRTAPARRHLTAPRLAHHAWHDTRRTIAALRPRT
jgi:hypothetical protein